MTVSQSGVCDMDIEEYARVFNKVRDKRDSTVFACAVVIEFSPLQHLSVEEKDELIEEATGKRINSDYTGWVASQPEEVV